MSRVSVGAFFALSFGGLAGCAAVAGLNQIQESPCPFGEVDCDGSASDGTTGDDATVDASADTGRAPDSTAADSTTEGNEDPEGGPYRDGDAGAGIDVGDAKGGSPDAEADAHDGAADAKGGDHDAMTGDAAKDAGPDCGPVDTVTNCSACGVACGSSPSSPGVDTAGCATGKTCEYTCKAGYLDCNASVAPDTDGCECPTPGSISAMCCGSACPTQHVTGFATGAPGTALNQTFYDCDAGITENLAMAACAQYSGNASNCATNTAYGTMCGNGDQVVCNFYAMTQNCVCWVYQGPAAAVGWAAASTMSNTCLCAAGSAALGDVPYH